MKKKMLAILIAGLIVATVFGAMSVSAVDLNKKQDEKTLLPLDGSETGNIGAFVFIEKPRLFSSLSRIIPITGATVICTDVNGETHDMEYELIEPENDFWAYMAYDVPVGLCEITATKEGYDSGTIYEEVRPGGSEIYKLKLEQNPISRSISLGMIYLLIHTFPMLRYILTI